MFIVHRTSPKYTVDATCCNAVGFYFSDPAFESLRESVS